MMDAIARLAGIPEPKMGRLFGWYHPRDWLPPHRVTHPERAKKLAEEFKRDGGWDCNKPNLLGYICGITGDYQLISGSHRHAAAKAADIFIPVDRLPYEYVKSIWGTDEWITLLQSQQEMR